MDISIDCYTKIQSPCISVPCFLFLWLAYQKQEVLLVFSTFRLDCHLIFITLIHWNKIDNVHVVKL